MNSDLQLTLLELIRRLNGISTLESGGLSGRRRGPADSTSHPVEISKTEKNTTRCSDTTSRTAPEDSKEEPLHDLRPRPKDRKGAIVE
uniref:X protein n=1 Tax=Aquatic bird bornavirus 1 TaxID=1715293 RepID=A0A0S0GAG6_9MONO|nr:x protein [Aquatic bird bornavirus 1]ALF62590.1 x protein [Aquatic bird bornavirus 1]UGC11878.1 X protein [Aquatic bird bornavirus 1]UGC11883.1 X protein [Aquatic bird bornavirus 1]UGC11888.1 X protein [Aquatic bird bornavirus 1]